MDSFRDSIKSAMSEYLSELNEKVDGLSEAELRWQASLDSNSILWLVWHMARVEDGWISGAIVGSDSIWSKSGWGERTGIASETNGYGDDMDDVRAMPNVPISLLLEYYDEVREETFRAIDEMSDADMANVDLRDGRDSTWGWILGHIVVEESQHLGQVAFIRGLIRGLNG